MMKSLTVKTDLKEEVINSEVVKEEEVVNLREGKTIREVEEEEDKTSSLNLIKIMSEKTR